MRYLFKPSWVINSVYDIQPEELIARGFRACIVDLDNTMIAWHNKDYTQEMKEWIQSLKQAGLSLYLISNNTTERVERVASPLDIDFHANALKPLKMGFKQALQSLRLPTDQVVVIGDQIMTDVIGANRMRLHSILVKPMVETDIIYSIINRQIEKLVMKWVGIDRSGDWGNQLGDKL